MTRSAVALLWGAMAAVASVSLLLGPVPLPPWAVGQALLHPGAASLAATVIWQVRLPEILGGLLVGMALALAGTVVQGILQNPLADPYVLGMSSGAALGASVTALVFPTRALLPVGALVGCLVSLAAVLAVGVRAGRSRVTLLLIGYSLSVILGAATALLLTLSHTALLTVIFWEMGNLSTIAWPQVGTLGATVAVGLAVCLAYHRHLDALSLGESQAHHLGVEVVRVRRILLVAAGIVTAVAVTYAGIIGFVGLVAPHVARRLLRAAHLGTLAAAPAVGGAFLVAADDIARSVPGVGQLPVGVVTALVGGPLFLLLLVRTMQPEP